MLSGAGVTLFQNTTEWTVSTPSVCRSSSVRSRIVALESTSVWSSSKIERCTREALAGAVDEERGERAREKDDAPHEIG